MRYFTRGGLLEHDRWGCQRGDGAKDGILIFTDTENELSNADMEALQHNSELDKIYGGHCFFFIDETKNCIIVTPSTKLLPTPDKAEPDDYLMRQNGKPGSLNLRQRFNDCRMIIKNAMGCAKCPLQGVECLSKTWTGMAVDNHHERASDFKHLKDTLADYTYVSPVMTREKHFAHAERHWNEHDFTLIDKLHQMRVENAINGAETRAFRKKACAVCPINGHCNPWVSKNHCPGPLPPSDEIDRIILAKHLPSVAAAPFPAWQFWTVAHFADIMGNQKFNRRRIRLAGISLTSGSWKVDNYTYEFRVIYDARPTGTAYTTKNYDRLLADFGDELPRTERESRNVLPKKFSDHAKALLFAILNMNHGARHATFCGSNSYSVEGRQLNEGSVSVRWGSGQFLIYPSEISSWRNYADTFDEDPPVDRAVILRSKDQT